jgi:hypothetical protein
MIGLPWFLLAIGIVLVLVGSMLAVLSAASRRKPPPINPKMRNKDIARHLRNEERVTAPALIRNLKRFDLDVFFRLNTPTAQWII